MRVLFKQDNNAKLSELIMASISAKKLKARSVIKPADCDIPCSIIYFFDPITIVDWAIAKELELPAELIEWRNQESKKANERAPEIERNSVDPKTSKNDTEYNLRTIGALALLLIEKTDGVKFGTREKPNKKAIYGEIQQLLYDMGLNEDGQSRTRMNDVLQNALDMAFTPKK